MSSIQSDIKYQGNAGITYASYVGSGVNTFVTPAANTKGIIFHFCSVVASTTSSIITVAFELSAITGYSSGYQLAYFNSGAINTTQRSLFIPAGMGLYSYSSSVNGSVTVMYEVL